MTNDTNGQPVAVWYFVGATFAGVGPTLFFSDPNVFLRIVFLVIALGLIAAGFVQLRRETGAGKRGGAAPEDPGPPS
ncbi:hypothetical protein AB3M83_12070 [Microbacterium sp. 179-B 1A2 NHS]|uniref:hypothetical protein n=1 Tax=Microbacterium sp. 179-B 1A2 NHS TaxID=3142383 RepID=UPI0039A2415A